MIWAWWWGGGGAADEIPVFAMGGPHPDILRRLLQEQDEEDLLIALYS
jgi:hypothetical protein